MKKLLLASALTLAAGAVSAETIILDETSQALTTDRNYLISTVISINTVTEQVCHISMAGNYRFAQSLSQNCERFQEMPDYAQANILIALEATGHAWRPTVPESFRDQAGNIADGIADGAAGLLNKWRGGENE
ncbi:MAG: hypothetical protein VX730_07460 [Pseudomonadota bacterium]|nr:hypothetical protein [Pseudomonadota bacterium]